METAAISDGILTRFRSGIWGFGGAFANVDGATDEGVAIPGAEYCEYTADEDDEGEERGNEETVADVNCDDEPTFPPVILPSVFGGGVRVWPTKVDVEEDVDDVIGAHDEADGDECSSNREEADECEEADAEAWVSCFRRL